MEDNGILTFLKDNFKSYSLPIGIACIGLVFIGYGLITSFAPNKNKSSDITFQEGAESSQQTTNSTAKTVSAEVIMVDISGAVVKPGVYSLSSDSRVQDAVIKAGGFAEDADRMEIARSINLAEKITDGEKIYIPFNGETLGAMTGATGKVSLNKATSNDLDQLPGIGPVTAEKVISNRPYQKIEDLLSKKVVSQSVFEKIKEKIGL